MYASELNRAVARATGETISTIYGRGFSLVEEHPGDHQDEICFGPNMVDWDELDSTRTQFVHRNGENVPSAA